MSLAHLIHCHLHQHTTPHYILSLKRMEQLHAYNSADLTSQHFRITVASLNQRLHHSSLIFNTNLDLNTISSILVHRFLARNLPTQLALEVPALHPPGALSIRVNHLILPLDQLRHGKTTLAVRQLIPSVLLPLDPPSRKLLTRHLGNLFQQKSSTPRATPLSVLKLASSPNCSTNSHPPTFSHIQSCSSSSHLERLSQQLLIIIKRG